MRYALIATPGGAECMMEHNRTPVECEYYKYEG